MNHATKMILVPHDLAPTGSKSVDSTNKFLSNLDEEMQKILLDQTLPIDAKIIQYNQILQRFQKMYREQNKPFQLEVKDMPSETPALAPSAPSDTSDETLTSLLNIVPDRSRKNAALLLEYARKNPNIKWTGAGEMLLNGNKIVGSNIIDLISDLARPKRTAGPPIGADVFIKTLINSNVPRELITNKKRLELLELGSLYAASPKSTSENDSPMVTPGKATPKKSSYWNPFRQSKESST